MKLYTYHRSSAAYRVRIALEWKGIAREDVFVDLASDEQRSDAYRAENPEMRVPLLVDDGLRLTQALAILEYLEERHPEPPLLPRDLAGRARCRQLALLIVADTQPLQNTGPIAYLADPLGIDERGRARWYLHWVRRGLEAVEARLADSVHTGRFCHGDHPTFADVCLIPQVANALRNGVDPETWPTVHRVHRECIAVDAFQRAAPEAQPDATAG